MSKSDDRLLALYERAFERGGSAYRVGKGLDACPFGPAPIVRTPLDNDRVFLAQAWTDGWRTALEVSAYGAGLVVGTAVRPIACPFAGEAEQAWVHGWVDGATLAANGFPEVH